MPFARILCPVDFSDASRRAVEGATVIAGYYGAAITALHVYSPLDLSVAGAATSTDEAREIARLRRLTADEFASATKNRIAVDVQVDIGQPAAVILDRAVTLGSDLIVMGTHGASGFQRVVLGSVTEKVLRRARCPVLTVPPRAQATSELPFKRLLCPVDFSDASLQAADAAFSLATESGAAVTLLHVVEWPPEEPPPPLVPDIPFEYGLDLSTLRSHLEAVSGDRLASLVPASFPRSRATTIVRTGKAYLQVLDVAATESIDLILIGVHGRNPIDMALVGSTTNQVVRRATCPVLTVRR